MRKPKTKTIKLTDTRQHFSELVNEVFRGETRIVVEKSGIPVAAIVSADDHDKLARLDLEREEAFKALDATREAFKDVPDEELEREVARAISEVRARNRQHWDRAAKAS
ncbi:MAG: type II toxin-antitoxin system Phd/YefM family antitoxin [Dehalococcoidia bacterium]|nr:type II toxin-antitoxin system Phd/YefM family antitoxin [Dehalococcoidia bacterium]